MRRKLLACMTCCTMIATMLVGCGNTEQTTVTTSEPTETVAEVTETASEGTEEVATSGVVDSDLSFEIVSKGFQHQYWQAVLKGSQQKAEELGVKIGRAHV